MTLFKYYIRSYGYKVITFFLKIFCIKAYCGFVTKVKQK